MLRDILNERRWSQGDLADCTLVVVHRGAPGDRREIPGHAIQGVLSGGLEIVTEAASWSFADGEATVEALDTVVVPFHRVQQVRGPDGGILWEK